MLRRYPFVFVFLLTALLICSAYYWHLPFNLQSDTEVDYLDSLLVFRVHVQEPPVQKANSLQLSVSVLSVFNPMNDSVHSCKQKAMIYLRTDSLRVSPAMGDILLVRTRFTRPKALFPGEFDYGNYLRLHHKVGVGYASINGWWRIGNQPVRTLQAYAALVQQMLVQRYRDAGLSGRALAFMSAITLGERDALDSELRQSFASAGAAHVLAVSGLHTGIIYLVLASLLSCFNLRRPLYEQRMRRVLLAMTIILAMWAYAFVTGLSPSVLRAVLMLTIVQVGWMCRRQSISLNTLAAAACICLWIEPLSLFDVSFQLSFSAVTAILLLVPFMNSVWKVKGNRIMRFARDLVTISLAATIGTLPVTLYHFGQVSRYFLLANILVIPAAYALVIIGAAVLLLAHTAVGMHLAVTLKYLSGWMCDYVSWIEHLPFALLQLHATPWMVVCLVAAIAFCWVSMQRKRLTWLMPAASAVALCCMLHVFDIRQTAQQQTMTIRGRTMYYKHGCSIEQHALDGRYTFFRFNGTDYVYAPYLSVSKRRVLEQFCAERNISQYQANQYLSASTRNAIALKMQ